MVSFRYSRINDQLLREVVNLVLHHGESVTVLGPRYGGKKHFITRVRQELEKAGVAPLVQIDLPRRETIATSDRLFQLIVQAVNQAVGEDISAPMSDYPGYPIEDQLFSPIDKLAQMAERPVVVIVPYVDGMAHSLARLLLQAIRPRVQAGKIIVVLSGETDLRELVHGPKSEFNCANQYGLQGFDLQDFRQQFTLYAAALNLRFENEREAEEYLWRLTGGNVHQLRVLFCAILETRARRNENPRLPLRLADIPDSLYKIEGPGVCRAEVFRQATRLVNHEPECWTELQSLIAGQAVKVHGEDSDPPNRLELAGVAVRNGNELSVASPLMRDFLQYYYTHKHFGDLYAKIGDWEKAFDYYRRLKPEERLRPSSTDDRAYVADVIKSLCQALFSEAAKGLEHVKRLLVLGSHYVLGFSEISFWQRNGKWVKQRADSTLLVHYGDTWPISHPSEEYDKAVNKILPQTGVVSPGVWEMPDAISQYGAIAVLPARNNDRPVAVTVCNYSGRVVISRERKLLIEEVLKSFVSAYEHAITVEYEKQRREVRDRHLEVINSIFQGLGYYIHDTRQMLTLAARELRNLGYKRVLFCLVDPERKRIQGVVDDADSRLGDEDVATLTDYPLDDPRADLQPYIIFNKEERIIPDATAEPLTCKRVVSLAGMKALAIVPIINTLDEAIGTIHIERADGAVPTKDEIEDLKVFAGQLAVAVELCERVNFLQSAFDKIPEPVGIVDRSGKLRYANRPAAKLLKLPSGWRDVVDAPAITEELIGGAILNAVNQSLSDGKPRVEHNEIEKDGKLYKIEIVSAAIRDWKKRTVGALGHVRDLSFIYEMFEAFRIVMNSESPMESMLVALKRLGHKWGRLYLVDADDPYLLVSKLCFGFKNPHHKQRFEEGLIKLVRRDVPDNDSWMAIESDSPLIFCFRQDMENLSRFTTRYGLEAITINNPEQQEELEKEQGEFWLDLPIIGKHERPLGKLTVGWDGNYRRDRLDLIKVLIERAGEFIEFQQMRDQKVEVNTTEKLMGVWAHHLATRLASLPIILAKYRAYERQTGELKAVNKDFQRILTETLTMMQRVKERLAPVVALRSELDLAEQIENTLKLALPEGAWQFQSDDRPFTIKADGDKLNIALLEMIQNSREIVGDDRKLCVNVALANGDDWAKLVYRDNGPGVPDEFKQKIFDEFFSRRPGGESSTGLGLSFVRRVAHAHGGKVEEKGQPGQGAEFVISIPKTA